MKTIRIISRKSLLARIQANIVAEKIKEEFSNINIEFLTKETSGDIDLSTPLHQMPDPGVFTNDIREELLKHKADIAVHSWKDLPVELQEGTEIVTTLKKKSLCSIEPLIFCLYILDTCLLKVKTLSLSLIHI